MRQLKSICSRLSRFTHYPWCVVSHRRCQYCVFSGNGFMQCRGVFSTVSDCRRFLLDQFMEDK